MKQILHTILLTVIVTAMASCGSSTPTNPKDVASSFLIAMNKADYEGAKKFATDDTKKLLEMTSTFTAMLPDSVKKASSSKKVEIIGEPKIEGDRATVTYKESDSPEPRSLVLIKTNSKWLVQQSKDNPDAGTPASSDETAAENSDEALPIAADSSRK